MAKLNKVSDTVDARFIYPNIPFAITEAYKMLRTNIDFSFTEDIKCPVIGITSAIKGEGKTATSINLAYALAETNKKVLFIEADMRLPSVSKYLKVSMKDGLSSILTGVQKNTVSCIVSDKTFSNLNFIFSGPIPPNPAELLNSNSMKKVLEVLKEEYDYIIVDLPPVSVVSDPVIVSKYTDGMVIVSRQDYSEKKALNHAIYQLKFVNAKILGIVYRGYKEASFGYSKKYGKGYSYE
ncbi:CpsD/CapB family tyrosine-protein kinase [Tannockella kyphosi]|uniref:CpsD/CapB family tyrosine-protein kinase n=1 Tax=Tannockella kyphosi TaxID=2899121 RepID=UPI00201321E1|nr:CpsD/CapB family tyrosine-protein kinase [Tannockella kyphosi]